MLRGPFAVTGAAWPGRVAQALKVQDNAMVMLQLRSPSLGSEAVRIMRQELAESQADERVHSMAIRPVAPCIAGSDIAALHLDTAESRSERVRCVGLTLARTRTRTRTSESERGVLAWPAPLPGRLTCTLSRHSALT